MMKRIFIVAVSTVVIATSCKRELICERADGPIVEETRALNSFKGIDLSGAFDVYVRQDESMTDGSVIVKAPADLMKYIETDIKGDILVIKNKKCFRGDNNIEVYVRSSVVNELSLHGSGNIVGENKLLSSSMDIELSGSGNINLDMKTSKLNTIISGSGNVTCFGQAEASHLKITGSGNIHNFGINTTTAAINIIGSGNIDVNASDQLDITIDGSGNVNYMNAPSITLDINGSGSVIKVN